MKYIVRPEAREDILRQFRYYLIEQDVEAVAERFLGAVQVAIEQLCKRPRTGTPKLLKTPVFAGLRSWPVKGFPAIRIYYLIAAKELCIVRVLHGKRDIDSVLDNE